MANITAKSDVQKQDEASVDALRKDLGPFVVAAEKTRMPMVFTGEEPGHPVIFANDAFLALTGYARAEVLAKNFQSLLRLASTRKRCKSSKRPFAESASASPKSITSARTAASSGHRCSSARSATTAG